MRANACAAGRLLVALACSAAAADSAAADDPKASSPQRLSADVFDSQARTWLLKRQAGKNALEPNIDHKHASAAKSIQRLEEIRVYGAIEPEDYVTPKRPPMLEFRARLERQRPRTPEEIVKGVLCTIGLCAGLPPEVAPEQRTEARTRQPFTPGFGRGTLQ